MPLALMSLQPMNSVKRSPQVTSIPRIYQMVLLLLWTEEKDFSYNDKHAITCVVLFLFGVSIHWSTKTQPAYVVHSTDSNVYTLYLVTKRVQFIGPILQTLAFKYPMAKLRSTRTFNLQLTLINQTTSQSGLIIFLSLIIMSKYQYGLLTNYPVKLNTIIHPECIFNIRSIIPLLDCHQS